LITLNIIEVKLINHLLLTQKMIGEKIPREKVKGFVYCKYIGMLPYATWKDKRKLVALAQLFHRAIDSGELIPVSKYSPEFRPSGTDYTGFNVQGELSDHIMKNITTFKGKEDEKVDLMAEIFKKEGIKIKAVKLKKVLS